MKKNHKHLILSLIFLLSSVALWTKVAPNEAPTPTIETVAVSALEVEGVWEQYALNDYGCKREFMARLDIRAEGGDFVAHPLSLTCFAYPKHAYRSFDHQKQGDTWTFKEQWSPNEVGQFTLELQPNGEYRGTATSLYDGSSFATVFVRVD